MSHVRFRSDQARRRGSFEEQERALEDADQPGVCEIVHGPVGRNVCVSGTTRGLIGGARDGKPTPMNATIDRAGRLVVPKPIREAAQLHPGTRVRFRVLDGCVEIEPVPAEVTFKRSGTSLIAVAKTEGETLTTADVERTLARSRSESASSRLP
ncbi:MAG: AbrB/MazE/SpoVT family DNA-binding domain-containing protein [Gammaproteobacteria bacterium]|nr:AbrB/MazE/SpoVT family DNA-binding domain-containing protein [Gammaproteobacteria bacterium]